MTRYYLAIDIGASNGRHIVGEKDENGLREREVFRFANGAEERNGRLIWDIDNLYRNVLTGIGRAQELFPDIASVSIDAWGVDYVLTDCGKPIYPVYAYRDGRGAAAALEVHRIMPFRDIYERTGISYQSFNTVYQLYDDMLRGRLDSADGYLMIPEYLNFMLTGVMQHEYTNQTTTALLDKNGRYDYELIDKLGLPRKLFRSEIARPGTSVGRITGDAARITGCRAEVTLAASHDTASAVHALKLEAGDVYLSSGTWSLLGVKRDAADTSEHAYRNNWTNEGGTDGTLFQKNIMGMWIIQSLRRELCPHIGYDEIEKIAAASDYSGIVDVNDETFTAPVSMASAVKENLIKKGIKPPGNAGEFFKCAYLSLAAGYGRAIEELRDITGRSYSRLIIAGGGAKNGYLNRLTEESAHIEVVAKPIEAAALGNLLIQAER